MTMFDVTPIWPEWFYPGKNAPECHKANVQRGLHPMGFPLLKQNPIEKRCRNCANATTHRQSKSWIKCDLVKATHGPATDIRDKWAACVNWKAESP